MQFVVKNRAGEVVAGFDDETDADDFVESHGAFGLSVEDDFEDNLEELTKYLDDVDKWTRDYVFDNSDYADNYLCLVCEDQVNWRDCIDEWLSGEDYAHLPESVAQTVWENIDPGFDSEAEALRNEYASYSGKGCCIGSFEIGEYEQQFDFSDDSILTDLHNSGKLDDYLDHYNGEVYPCRSRRREKNEDTGYYEGVGRETYNPYNRKSETLEVIVAVGGQVQIVIPEERMRELVTEAILQLARKK